MAYKSILTFMTDSITSAAALSYAANMTTEQNGHLDAFCLGIDRTQVGYYYAGANALIQQEAFAHAQEDAGKSEAWTRKTLEGSPFTWAVDKATVALPSLARLVSIHARFSDVVILPKPYGEGRGGQDEALLESALFEGHASTIIVPDKAKSAVKPKRIVVAWNESLEALNAIRAALPLMISADLVNITIIDPPAHGANRSDPGGPLSQMLARHGVKAEISVLAKSLPRVADVLTRHIVDTDADMLVMGAYGHSRFREAILGGATRHMLERTEVPVFMAH
ncbi:universal stress protein [Falsihalocynthiibacter arcticus]|uniref:Universal stress protein n=1 Tax=Falsihalocynthiibacter arcticus TaxID=1579316 RepID=A0A126UZK5_9RHOB|nr:universal stress protein [Falsihalocynthiibacter arcticus]AML51317.1 universal stress protein [Falsihalocynthiibacter arcticus]